MERNDRTLWLVSYQFIMYEWDGNKWMATSKGKTIELVHYHPAAWLADQQLVARNRAQNYHKYKHIVSIFHHIEVAPNTITASQQRHLEEM